MAGGLIALVVVLVILGVLATQLLSRIGTSNRAGDQAAAKLAALSEALEQFVAGAGRLPCPADPTIRTDQPGWGDEAVPSPNLGVCQFPEGTVPWRTIGARQEDAIDAWGWKVSYRVFSGTPGVAGSLTQPSGATMIECDTFEPGAGAATPVTGVSGGLCAPNADPTLRSTRPSSFLAGKGLPLTDTAPPQKTDIAYVLISHGQTGRGAYTIAGQRLPMPAAGDELNNTAATGPFVIRAFSPAGTDPSVAGHFDDLLHYRTLPELVRRTQLVARNWPEPVAPGTSGAVFDQATVASAVGGPVTPGSSVGSVTVTFVGVAALGTSGGGTPTDISFELAGGQGGLGVAGGGSALLQSSANESLTLQFSDATNTKFAATVGDFGTYGTFIELVQFAFYAGGVNVATKVGAGCKPDGGLASFSMDVGAAFDTVVITPAPALDTSTLTFSGITAMLVSEVSACPTSAATCITSLTDAGNACSVS